MRAMGMVFALLLLLPPAFGQEEPAKPDTPMQAAEKVLAAFREAKAAALKSLAERINPDPWTVADALCLKGEYDAATAFAEAAPVPDTETLPDYIASRRNADPDTEARRAYDRALAALGQRDPDGALATISAAKQTGDSVIAVRLEMIRARALAGKGKAVESADVLAAAAETAERMGWLRAAAILVKESGLILFRAWDKETAIKRWRKRLALHLRRGDRSAAASAQADVGLALMKTGRSEEALKALNAALEIHEENKYLPAVAWCHGTIGDLQKAMGDYGGALESLRRAARIQESLGNRRYFAVDLSVIGDILRIIGDFDGAIRYQERALRIRRELGDAGDIASSLGHLANVELCRGNHAKALILQTRTLAIWEKLGKPLPISVCMTNLGSIHLSLEDWNGALEWYEKAMSVRGSIGGESHRALLLGNMATAHLGLGEIEHAKRLIEQVAKIHEKWRDRENLALTLVNLGSVHGRLGHHERARELSNRARKILVDLGERWQAIKALANRARACHALGESEMALADLETALSEAEELKHPGRRIEILGEIARLQTDLGRYAEAAETVARAVALLGESIGGLSEDVSSAARVRHASLFETGLTAAVRLDDPDRAGYFLESGRAMALLESLRSRDAVRDAVLPKELLDAELAARTRETASQHAYARAVGRGNRELLRERREELDAARKVRSKVIQRIQLESRAAASILYPEAASPETIRAHLPSGSALVSYARARTKMIALVVTAETARIVPLGKAEAIESACAAVDWTKGDPARAVAALRSLVVDPLKLEKSTRRLLVSPDGALSGVPFALLAPGRVVSYVPSGTALRHLAAQPGDRSRGVLALGAPEYGDAADPGPVALHRGDRALLPLPASREEALAVGTEVLLGKDATEAGLAKTLAGRSRWRAVHLACHGLIDTVRPTLSSLAVTPDPENDGFLTCLEVFRMKIPADLVVLSACETAKGRIYRAEGIVGLTRAFMVAGAPRVLCSLWKVDDEATRALMVKFYELWNPEEGKGLPAATALKQAQEFVRGQEKWKHPYYWAAWVLWGLPD